MHLSVFPKQPNHYPVTIFYFFVPDQYCPKLVLSVFELFLFSCNDFLHILFLFPLTGFKFFSRKSRNCFRKNVWNQPSLCIPSKVPIASNIGRPSGFSRRVQRPWSIDDHTFDDLDEGDYLLLLSNFLLYVFRITHCNICLSVANQFFLGPHLNLEFWTSQDQFA